MDFEKIKSAAEGYKAEMSRFLRDMISHPSESCEEKEVVMCIKAEMEKLGFDKVEIDGLGNVIGWMGQGEKIIAIDSHIDTVGIGNISNWEADILSPTRAMKPTTSSSAGAEATRRAAWPPPCTAPRS